MSEYVELTKEEENAINTLNRLAKRWPESLWLFSASGSLWVMQKNSDGEKSHDGDGYDQECALSCIDIENDGGDW